MNNIAAIAVALEEAGTPAFKKYALQILKNAKAMADELMREGCKLVTNGTDNHLMLMDCVKSFNANGKEIQEVLDEVGMTANKNAIPDDTLPPFAPSGLRLGSPAMTTRGMKEKDMRQIARWIVEVGNNRTDKKKLAKIKKEVTETCLKFPVPGID